jgi:bifunctional NMN adenylyltransferase/nudix hydrolase
MSTKKYDLAVFIGRFQPFHSAHKATVDIALNIADNVLVLVGSSFEAPTPKNPLSYETRRDLIRGCFPNNDQLNIDCLVDYLYNEDAWVAQVVDTVDAYAALTGQRIVLVGKEKDDSSYYLKMFPQWDFFDTSKLIKSEMSATDVRNDAYGRSSNPFEVPPTVRKFLDQWKLGPEYAYIVQELQFLEKYKMAWEAAPYPPTFLTTDAIVVKSGHILLVQRAHAPGKGLWALPGGFVNINESIQDAMIRELREETGLKVPVPVLVGSIKQSKVYDHPKRSLRGRTVTHAYHISLGHGLLPEVRGADDAERAEWVSIADLRKMRASMFEDHWSIIFDLLGV